MLLVNIIDHTDDTRIGQFCVRKPMRAKDIQKELVKINAMFKGCKVWFMDCNGADILDENGMKIFELNFVE